MSRALLASIAQKLKWKFHFSEQRQSLRSGWVTGCLRDYVGITTGVPQIADDSSTSTTNVENIQHRAIRCRLARASGHRPRQQALKFLQVVEFGPNVFKVMRGNLADLTT